MRELEWGSEGANQTSCWDSNLGSDELYKAPAF